MRMSATYQLAGAEPATHPIKPAAIVAWEKATGKSLTEIGSYGFTGICELTYHALRGAGELPRDADGAPISWAEFLDRLEDLTTENPTQPLAKSS